MTSILRQMSDIHYTQYISHFHTITDLMDFLMEILMTFKDLVINNVFPRDWNDMIMLQNRCSSSLSGLLEHQTSCSRSERVGVGFKRVCVCFSLFVCVNMKKPEIFIWIVHTLDILVCAPDITQPWPARRHPTLPCAIPTALLPFPFVCCVALHLELPVAGGRFVSMFGRVLAR